MKVFERTVFQEAEPQERLINDYSECPLPVLEGSEMGYGTTPPVGPQLLEQKMFKLGVRGTVIEIHTGPVVATYYVLLDERVRVASLERCLVDLARVCRVPTIRMAGVYPERSAVSLEIPMKNRGNINLGPLFSHKGWSDFQLPVALGCDTVGEPLVVDLADMPHLLVAGTTGSGKSVFLNALITGLLCSKSPNQVRFFMVDPKQVELAIFGNLPHLLEPVATDVVDAIKLVELAMHHMELRYSLLAEAGVRNIQEFNSKVEFRERRERIVFVIDEFANLIYQHKKIDRDISQLAAKGRAAGIHLVVATQRPSVDVITGIIKANFDKRIAFKCSTKVDSGVILDRQGTASSLLGRGDGIYMNSGLSRFQGAYVSDEEIASVVKHWQVSQPTAR